MTIIIRETKEETELFVNDPAHQTDITNDVLGNTGIWEDIKEEDDQYIMDQESFEWWNKYAQALTEINELVYNTRTKILSVIPRDEDHGYNLSIAIEKFDNEIAEAMSADCEIQITLVRRAVESFLEENKVMLL